MAQRTHRTEFENVNARDNSRSVLGNVYGLRSRSRNSSGDLLAGIRNTIRPPQQASDISSPLTSVSSRPESCTKQSRAAPFLRVANFQANYIRPVSNLVPFTTGDTPEYVPEPSLATRLGNARLVRSLGRTTVASILTEAASQYPAIAYTVEMANEVRAKIERHGFGDLEIEDNEDDSVDSEDESSYSGFSEEDSTTGESSSAESDDEDSEWEEEEEDRRQVITFKNLLTIWYHERILGRLRGRYRGYCDGWVA